VAEVDPFVVLNEGRSSRGLTPVERSVATDTLELLGPARVFRLVPTEQCTLRDFMSYEVLGRPMPPSPNDRLKLGWAGVSTFLTAESAISRSTTLTPRSYWPPLSKC
jgi:hypothetical protein